MLRKYCVIIGLKYFQKIWLCSTKTTLKMYTVKEFKTKFVLRILDWIVGLALELEKQFVVGWEVQTKVLDYIKLVFLRRTYLMFISYFKTEQSI